jgi:phosphatidylglycerophosphate synthase
VISFACSPWWWLVQGVTLAGYALRLGALLGWLPLPCGLAGLACDAADGALARRWGVASRFGAELDIEGDAGLAFVAALLLLMGPYAEQACWAGGLALFALPSLQAAARAKHVRVSGSAPLVLSALAARWWAG